MCIRDRLIGDRQQLIECFEDDHLGPESTPDAAELQADHARADDDELARHRAQLERVPRIDDKAMIEGQAFELGRYRAGGQHDMAGRELARRTVECRHFDPSARQ